MKKVFTISLLFQLMLGMCTSAQTNLNFEGWSGIEPNNWASSNVMTQPGNGAQTVFKESVNPGEGSFSVKMVTGSCPTCPDFSILGPFGPATPLPNPFGGGIQLGSFETPGIAYTQRPLSVDFRYKSNPANNDACGFQVELTRYNPSTEEDETIGEGYFEASNDVAVWTSVNIPIVYYSDLTPDRLNIWATSSIGSIPDLSAFGFPDLPVPTPVAGSEFYIDAIVLNLPSCDNFTISMSGSGESGIGVGDGTASVTPSGGTPPYSYNWSNLESAQSINGLLPGPYIVTVTDANGCQKVGTYYVALGGCNVAASITGTNSSSNSIFTGNGAATVNVTGGNGPYEYQWNTGATTASISNLAVGTYAVFVNEQNNPFCGTWAYFTVYGPDGPTTAIDDLNEDVLVSMAYPNPSNGILNFSSESDIRQIVVVNSIGATVWSSSHNASLVQLDLSNQPTGIYYYSLLDESGKISAGSVVIE